MIEENEIWKDIPGWEGLYQASNLGNIKSLEKRRFNGIVCTCRYRERILKLNKGPKGYKQVALCRDGKCHTTKVHQLIAKTFLPNPDFLPMVNHKDLNKANNNVSNLEWVTAEENQRHAVANGVHNNRKGRLTKRARRVIVFNPQGEEFGVFESFKATAIAINASSGNLYLYFSGKCNHVKGYKFKLA